MTSNKYNGRFTREEEFDLLFGRSNMEFLRVGARITQSRSAQCQSRGQCDFTPVAGNSTYKHNAIEPTRYQRVRAEFISIVVQTTKLGFL